MGANYHGAMNALRRGTKTALWRASHTLRPGIPLRVDALSFTAHYLATR